MSQRTTITLPEDLYERLQSVKERLNLSGLCQEALLEALEQEGSPKEPLSEIEQLANRLKTEKAQQDTRWREQGLADGHSDALRLHFTDFLQAERRSAQKGDPESLEREFGFLRGRYTEELYFNRDRYLEGWLAGVMATWEKVKPLVFADGKPQPGPQGASGKDELRTELERLLDRFGIKG